MREVLVKNGSDLFSPQLDVINFTLDISTSRADNGLAGRETGNLNEDAKMTGSEHHQNPYAKELPHRDRAELRLVDEVRHEDDGLGLLAEAEGKYLGARALSEEIHTESRTLPDGLPDIIGDYIERASAEGPVAHPTAAAEQQTDRSKEIFRLNRDPETYEVTVESDITLEQLERQTPAEDWKLLKSYMTGLKQELDKRPEGHRSITFLNPTMEGGGVAMMRPPLVHTMRLFGIDARWFVMEGPKKGEPNVFKFTKQMHNLIQRRVPDRITEWGKALHKKWAKEDNGSVLLQQPAIRQAAGIVLDDPQPAPLAEEIKRLNPNVIMGWRNHIDNDGELLMDPSTPQGEVHSYLQDELGLRRVADFCIYHPDINDRFIPTDNYYKSYVAPATVEPNDDMNRELTGEEINGGIDDINHQIAAKNQQALQEGRLDDVQEPVNTGRDRIVLIARFDESKGMDQAMELYAQQREVVMQEWAAQGITDHEPPQLILIGNGSKDDPSGEAMEQEMLRLRREQYGHIKNDIIVQRLLHNYVAINAMMYNQNPDTAVIALQMSTAEGCETRISDWVNHGIPTVVANIGGMPLQIKDGESGFILGTNGDGGRPELPNDVSNSELNRGAATIAGLITDIRRYRQLRETTFAASERFNKREYTTTANVTRLARMFHRSMTGLPPDKVWRIQDMLDLKVHSEELAA